MTLRLRLLQSDNWSRDQGLGLGPGPGLALALQAPAPGSETRPLASGVLTASLAVNLKTVFAADQR